MKPLHFRILITVSLILTITAIVFEIAFESMLPFELQRYIAMQDGAALTSSDALLAVLMIPVLLGLLVGYIGLYTLKGWARLVFSISSGIGYLGALLVQDPTVVPGLVDGVSSLSSLADGALIAAMFFTEPIKSMFDGKHDEAPPQRTYLTVPPPRIE